jgi:hypothetical protein
MYRQKNTISVEDFSTTKEQDSESRIVNEIPPVVELAVRKKSRFGKSNYLYSLHDDTENSIDEGKLTGEKRERTNALYLGMSDEKIKMVTREVSGVERH